MRRAFSSPNRAEADTCRRSGSQTPSPTCVSSRVPSDPLATRTRNNPTEMVSMTSASTFTIWWSCWSTQNLPRRERNNLAVRDRAWYPWRGLASMMKTLWPSSLPSPASRNSKASGNSCQASRCQSGRLWYADRRLARSAAVSCRRSAILLARLTCSLFSSVAGNGAPLVVLDENLSIQNANRAFYEAFGLSQGATLHQTIYEAGGGRFDLPEVRTVLDQLNSRFSELNDVEIEYQQDHGQPRVLLLNARRLRTPDQKQLVLMAFEDITERKRAAEARYRRLFESARDGIVLVDAATGEILDLNPFTERLLGYARSELVGRGLWVIEPTSLLPTLRTAIEQIRDQGMLRLEDLALRTKDGRDLQTEVIANVYMEGDRAAIQFNIRDVSVRKKFARELQETQKLESLGLLAGGIAHDFNNLLTGIMGNASLAYSETSVNQPVRRRLREIVQASERAASLTRQVLAYAGKGRFVIETVDLGDLVKEISVLVRTSIPKTVELKLDLAPNLPPIDADPAQVQQVVMNLVINGAEAIGENTAGKVEIRSSLLEINAGEAPELFGPGQSAAGAYVQLEVRDTGSGMDEATKSRIFDPFFTTKFTGRGLGLAAVQGIVKGHGGAIRVYSTPGHGTTFLIQFPVSRRNAAAVLPKGPSGLSIPAGSVALVIDDEEAIRELATNVLSRAGMRVLLAEDGKSGVELFRRHNRIVSTVILDLTMPVMGGEEALPQIKRINPDVPVILSTGFDESEAVRSFSGLKPQGFLQKPYTTERLLEAVAATLNRPTNRT